MKANKLFLLASFFLSSSLTPIAAQSKKEKKQQTEQAVREAVDAKTYKINVDRVMPMKGGSKPLTSDYSLEIRNDSVYSYLPYFGANQSWALTSKVRRPPLLRETFFY